MEIEKKDNARELCFLHLIKSEKNGSYSNLEISNLINNNNLTSLDKAFATRLFYGVTEKKLTLEFFIKNLAKKSLEQIDIHTRYAIKIALYQIYFMDKIPYSAACDESVKIIKKYNPRASSFVNAVIRNFIGKKEALTKKIGELGTVERLSVRYSCGTDLLNLWISQYGHDITEKILEFSQNIPDLCLAVNTLKIRMEEFEQKLGLQGINCKRTEISPNGIVIKSNIAVNEIAGFDEGHFFVQDEASQICSLETDAGEGSFFIDSCAAPGGKSLYAAIKMGNKGKILALDLHKNKLKLLEKSAEKAGIDIIEARENNSMLVNDELKYKADVVLCDVPCSGFGVINKKPEIKYKKIDDIKKLPETQYKILSACSEYVRENGTLIYSTCTLNKSENEEVIEKFLSENKNFVCDDFKYIKSDKKGMKTFFPFENSVDGFFLVKLRRVGV